MQVVVAMWRVKELQTMGNIDAELNDFISLNHIENFEVVGYQKGSLLTYVLIKYWEELEL